MTKYKNQRGFSLIELLIVVAIIGIIAAMAIPNLLASKRAANEGSAQSSMRTIHTAEVTYQATAGNGGWGTLAQLQTVNMVDIVLGAGSKSGYTFSLPAANITTGSSPTYFATAIPSTTTNITRTGHRNFAISDDGVLRGNVGDTGAASRTTAQALSALGN